MKKIGLIIVVFIFLFGIKSYSQSTLYKENGVVLSYTYSYENTLNCGNESFDQYKITGYFENYSGNTIRLDGFSSISHIMYRNKLDVGTCKHPFPSSCNMCGAGLYLNNSSYKCSYYILVPSDSSVPEPSWSMPSWNYE